MQGALLSQGLLRTDGGGPDTPYTDRMLAENFLRIALFHEDELGRWLEWFTRLFEPALMMAIGALVGLIVVLLYLPIFQLADSIR